MAKNLLKPNADGNDDYHKHGGRVKYWTLVASHCITRQAYPLALASNPSQTPPIHPPAHPTLPNP